MITLILFGVLVAVALILLCLAAYLQSSSVGIIAGIVFLILGLNLLPEVATLGLLEGGITYQTGINTTKSIEINQTTIANITTGNNLETGNEMNTYQKFTSVPIALLFICISIICIMEIYEKYRRDPDGHN